jgi:hypothetical protein
MFEAIEILTAQELAQRSKVKTSWVMDATQPATPIPPHHEIGRHNRYEWNKTSLIAWLKRKAENN